MPTPTDKRVLFIVTSASRIGPHDRKTGYEFSEVAHPYLAFVAGGFTVDFCSPAGGVTPEDGYDSADRASSIFRESAGFERLNASQPIADVALDDYDAIFFPGGLGPMVDLLDDPHTKQLIARAHESGRVIGAVCHGPVALLNTTLSDGSEFLAGRTVTGFTAAEERGHSERDVPFMLDAALTAHGARHTHAAPFEPQVVVDRRLVTGQNPASAAGVATAMISLMATS